MNGPNPKLRVTKTDTARFINEHSEQLDGLIPQLPLLREKYLQKCAVARKAKIAQFGFWLKDNKPILFERAFRWATKNQDAVLGITYPTDATETQVPAV